MAEITVTGDKVETVFDLLGRKENDITFALGWGLAQSDDLLHEFLEAVRAPSAYVDAATLDLQRYRKDESRAGITDIEISSPLAHVIVEAKRGWNIPHRDQLLLYLPALQSSRAEGKDVRFVVLTQWGEEAYVRSVLGSDLDGVPIVTLGLGQIANVAALVAARERRLRFRQLMLELAAYLRGVAYVRDRHDNRVYVVSLSKEASEMGVSYIDVVRKHGIYWYPAGGRGGWPKTPFNYMGFRYHGTLQSIHYVESASVVPDLSEAVDGFVRPQDWGPAWLLTLGPAIPIPPGIRTGPKIQRSARRTIDIDLLLTSPTISEALEQMRTRYERQ
jgi:hypothetical protein